MNDKIYIGLNLDQLNLIHRLLDWELDREDSGDDDYRNELESIIKIILKEVEQWIYKNLKMKLKGISLELVSLKKIGNKALLYYLS